MCGIAAIHSKTETVQAERIAKGLRTLLHRGPDQQNQWIANNGRVALGHTRLSIIGLENGTQPLSSEDGKIRAVVNGELYGFEQIRKELESLGHQFSTESDSEILVHLYEEFGTACFSHLRGEFAFVLWDARNETLFGGRDRFGIKPLYYSNVNDTTYFASEIKALFAMGVKPEWDFESQFQMHSAYLAHQSRTLFAGVYALPPGHFLLIKRSEKKIIPYWDFDYPEIGLHNPLDFETATSLVREKLQESVRIRLRADVPVGVYLSGGIDSCSILGLAARETKNLKTFTLCFDHESLNEEKIAQEMAKDTGAEFCPIPVTSAAIAENFSKAVIHSECMLTNTHAVAKFLLSQVVRKSGYKVVLTGEGSDEIFAGYVPFKRDMLLYNSPEISAANAEQTLLKIASTNTASQGMFLKESEKAKHPTLGHLPTFLEAFLVGGAKLRPLLNPEFVQSFAERIPLQILLNEFDLNRQVLRREPLHKSMYIWSKTMLPNYILVALGDRMEMANSVEGRVPFLDHQLVELVAQLPANYKIQGTTEKHILREAMRPFLTKTVYQREKHPFIAPAAILKIGDPIYQFVQDTLRGPHGVASLPFYQKELVLQLLDGLPKMSEEDRTTLDPLLLMMLSNVILQQKLLS